MNRFHHRVVRFVAGFSALGVATLAIAGPLTPPATPITSTGKTLAEIEPRIAINATNTPGDSDASPSLFKITQPGSYYLTGNITGVAGKNGIEIAASGVTLDLNGFDLVGTTGPFSNYDGINVSVNSLTNISVINGSIRNWGDIGLNLAAAPLPAKNCRVDGVVVSGNASDGIRVSAGTIITNCSAHKNTGNGITTGTDCTIANCSATENVSNGFTVGSGSAVSNCSASFNSGSGFTVGSACSVSNCSASGNSTSGFSVQLGSMIEGCTARSNVLGGIVCSSNCVIRGNACSFNGNASAGIHVTGSDNRIEGNNCTGANRGIDVDGPGNIIVRNTCSGNTTNWDIVANNYYAPIIDRTGVATTAVTGAAAAGTLSTVDGNANFSY
jgi:parallel beta-helix repeat protein